MRSGRHDARRAVRVGRQRRAWAAEQRALGPPAARQWTGGGAECRACIRSASIRATPDACVVGVSSGGAWTTRDGGESWEDGARHARRVHAAGAQYEPNTQDAHLSCSARQVRPRVWVQHHNGVFRPTDGGASWSEIADVPAVGVRFRRGGASTRSGDGVVRAGGQGRVPVPVDGSVVVNRTRDGGRTFEVLRDGLPQEHAYDLVYRHALDVDGSGEVLAFGSTTGSLWVSETAATPGSPCRRICRRFMPCVSRKPERNRHEAATFLTRANRTLSLPRA